MLHRQVPHNAKGRGNRSIFFTSLLGFVLFSFFCSFMVWGWFGVFYFYVLLCFFLLNTEPPRFSCFSNQALKKICQTRMNLSLDKLFLQL